MKTRTPSEALLDFKRLNKDAREKRAVKNGHKDAASYMAELERLVRVNGSIPTKVIVDKPKKTKNKKVWPIIHVADVLDASGSMAGAKFTAALKGINQGILALKKSKEDVTYTYTLCDFSDDFRWPYIMKPLDDVLPVSGRTRGATALYDAIGYVMYKIMDVRKPDDKVLINVYTDGQENASRKFDAKEINKLITDMSDRGITVTFVGTERDTREVIQTLNIHASNTLSYDGTAKGLEKSLEKTVSSRASYSSSVSRGEDVSKGFYKDIN